MKAMVDSRFMDWSVPKVVHFVTSASPVRWKMFSANRFWESLCNLGSKITARNWKQQKQNLVFSISLFGRSPKIVNGDGDGWRFGEFDCQLLQLGAHDLISNFTVTFIWYECIYLFQREIWGKIKWFWWKWSIWRCHWCFSYKGVGLKF